MIHYTYNFGKTPRALPTLSPSEKSAGLFLNPYRRELEGESPYNSLTHTHTPPAHITDGANPPYPLYVVREHIKRTLLI